MNGAAVTKRSKILLHRFSADERGATAIEYAMIALIVAIGIIPALLLLQGTLVNLPAWGQIVAALGGR
jgi:Flp pilus assembly pilin Flp